MAAAGDGFSGRRQSGAGAPAPGRDPEQQAPDAELRQALQAALDDLPAHYRTVFLPREIDEMSTPETARRLGISDACVQTRLLRARKLVRETLRLSPH